MKMTVAFIEDTGKITTYLYDTYRSTPPAHLSFRAVDPHEVIPADASPAERLGALGLQGDADARTVNWLLSVADWAEASGPAAHIVAELRRRAALLDAPKPHADLAQVLRDTYGEYVGGAHTADEVAEALHAEGVRVVRDA